MKNNGITYYKTEPIYSNDKFSTKALGKEGLFSIDEKKTIGLTGKEVDNNFLVLEGRDVYNFYFDTHNNLTIETLNGDRYIVNFKDILQQSDWEEKDVKSISYIKNKPQKISDFQNDLGYTKTTFSSSIYKENYDNDEIYEIGYISTDNKAKRIYGKVFLWPQIKTVNVEFNESIQNYVFNMEDDMFKKNKISYFLLNSFFGENSEPVRALITFNHETLYSSNIVGGGTSVPVIPEINQMNVLLDGNENNDVYMSFLTMKPYILTCFENEEKKYFTMSPLTTYNQTVSQKTNVLIKNETNEENIVICATDLNDSIINEVYIFNGENVKVLYDENENVTLECLFLDNKELTECNWELTNQGGEIITYENSARIEFVPSSNTAVRCFVNN